MAQVCKLAYVNCKRQLKIFDKVVKKLGAAAKAVPNRPSIKGLERYDPTGV